jgi:hypothetical protein
VEDDDLWLPRAAASFGTTAGEAMDPGSPWPDLVARAKGACLPVCGAEGGGGRRPVATSSGGKLRHGGMLRPAVALTAAVDGGHDWPVCGWPGPTVAGCGRSWPGCDWSVASPPSSTLPVWCRFVLIGKTRMKFRSASVRISYALLHLREIPRFLSRMSVRKVVPTLTSKKR